MGLQSWPFTTSGNYTVSDANDIEIADGVAKLKYFWDTGLTFYANYNSSFNADFTTGIATPVVNGSPSINTSIKKFGDGSLKRPTGADNEYLRYSGGADFSQVGTVSFWIYFENPSPAYTYYFFGIDAGDGSNEGRENRFELFFTTQKSLSWKVRGADESYIVSISETWNPNSGQWYHIELDMNLTAGESRMFIDGVQLGSTDTSTGTRNGIDDYLYIPYGLAFGSGYSINFYIDDVRIYNVVKHTSNFTPPIAELSGAYSITKPYVQPTSQYVSGDVQNWSLFTETLGGNNEGLVKYILSDDNASTWKYWNGSAWVVGGDDTNNNTASEVSSNINEFSTDSFLFRAYLISDGSQQVELGQLDLQYLGKTGYTWPFTLSYNYTVSDSDKILIEDGVTKLIPPHLKNGDTHWDDATAVYHFDNDYTDVKGSYTGTHSGTGTGFNTSAKLGNYCADFNGGDDYISVSSFPYIQLGSGYNATIIFWAKILYADKYILAKNTDYNSASSFEFGVRTDGYGYLKFICNGSDQVSSNTVVADNTWRQIGIVLNGTTGTWYVNGVADGTFTIGSNTEKAVSLLIGARRRVDSSDIGDFYGGQLDELIFLNTNLSAAQMSAFYTTQNARNFAIDKPYVQPSAVLDPDSIVNWLSFSASLGGNNGGSVGYVISRDGGSTWDYYNSGWQYGSGNSSNYNTVTQITDNIANWDSEGPDTFLFRAYLISDGSQQVELDEVGVNYTLQTPQLSFLSAPTFFMEKTTGSFLYGLLLLEETLQKLLYANADLLYENTNYLSTTFPLVEATRDKFLTANISLQRIVDKFISGNISLVKAQKIYLSASFFMEKTTGSFTFGDIGLVYTKGSFLYSNLSLFREDNVFLNGNLSLVNYITPHNVSGIFLRLNNVMRQIS